MMAGVVPKRATSGRKQWTLHDGPRSSLKRLRSQMATDGCPESQVVLAKQLLDEPCEIETEMRENEQLGVYWLIKASEQGNTEATNLLKTCLQTGKGITELNYLDVKQCISMTQHEKLARKAAREMFASLSNGGDYITSDQLQRKILAIERDQLQTIHENGCVNGELAFNESESDEETDWSHKSDQNEKLTEELLVSAAVDYSHGHLPLVNRTLCLSDPDLRALDNIPLIQRSILHPVLALKILYYKLVKFLGQGFTLFFPLAKSEVQLLVLMVVYTLVSADNILYFFPLVLYYASFIAMVISTFQMLQIKREFHDFRLWSGLFITYSGGDLNSEDAEFLYVRNNLKPYALFFGSLLLNFLVYPVIVDQWIPQSELMIISFCLTFATLLGFMYKRRGKTVFDLLVFFSFGINVLAKYPYETDPVVAQGWRFLDLKIPTFASYVIGNGIEFCINFRLFLYMFIPLLLVKIASRQDWKGTYQMLIPHCVTLSWLQVCIVSSEGATMYGLLRGSLALVGVVLFLPLVGLTSVILPAAALAKWVVASNFFLGVCVFVGATGLGLAVCWVCAQTRFSKITAFIQVVSTIFAVLTLIKSNYKNEEHYFENKLPEYLSWDVYQRFCHQPVWQEENIAIAQVKCSELHNSHINWDGYINDIKISSISNKFQTIIDHFPVTLRHYLYCFYGEETRNDCTDFPPAVREECSSFYNAIKSTKTCSLQKYNSYTFEITTKVQSAIWGKSPEVTLVVDDYFRNFTLGLKPNDHIWFKGTLFNNEVVGSDGILGGFKTHVKLDEIGCLACSNNKLTNVKKEIESRFDIKNVIDGLVLGLKFVLNVILSPVVVFK
ncbi:wolframin isoform X1 [Tribolium castaneum]|uniref:Wolframin-like Protein n=1 Tax=Tribolium castaneum TaxID=7070 RepID=D6X0P3_TRICA|nr:PREDICTED: wolframin isoform X1 [Tribolium castaneum]EFA10125.2 Wolframin-like Protein [Tribolium castaneum]|eukprot:XP_973480.2 PREDICTED: wolframin isoform X1 [Tribolium castaneum]